MALHKTKSFNQTRSGLYFLLTLLVIAISGNPAMGLFGKEAVYIGTLTIFVGLWVLNPLKIKGQDAFVLVLFALLATAHVTIFGSTVVNATLGFLIKLGIALLAVKMIPAFSRRYVSVMYVLSLISFLFWAPMYFGVDMRSEFSSMRAPLPSDSPHFTVGVYTLNEEWDGSIRNMGMFWEPGAFAGYLILALFFLFRDGQGQAVFSKQGLVLIAALISTQSTTGYLVSAVLAVFYAYNFSRTKGMLVRLFVLPVVMAGIVAGTYVAIKEIPFLGEKINNQFEAASVRDSTSRINRFGNFLYDLEWVKDRPIVGWSATPETRYAKDRDVANLVAGQGNGLTGFAIKFGLVGLAAFFGFFAYTTLKATGSLSVALFGVLILALLLNGEQFLNFPMFLSLMFMPRNKLKVPTTSSKVNGPRMQFAAKGASGRL